MLRPDLNPILDEGAPTSTGGMMNAIELCDALGVHFNMEAPRKTYYHSWGTTGENRRIIIGHGISPQMMLMGSLQVSQSTWWT